MAKYSSSSKSKLDTAHNILRTLFSRIITRYDNTIITGYRSESEQNQLFSEGLTKVKYPNSNHNVHPSRAIDSAPYIPGRGIPWPQPLSFMSKLDAEERAELNRWLKDYAQFYHYGGFVQGTADELQIPLRWGGDWDKDRDVADQTFDDLVHFELTGNR